MRVSIHSAIKKMSPQLLVADIERSIAFYTQILGFMVDFRYGDFYSGISRGGCSIHLKSGSPIEAKESRRKNDDLDLVFSVDNIEGVYAELSGKQVEIIQPIRTMPYGKEFYAADPDGHILGFVEET